MLPPFRPAYRFRQARRRERSRAAKERRSGLLRFRSAVKHQPGRLPPGRAVHQQWPRLPLPGVQLPVVPLPDVRLRLDVRLRRLPRLPRPWQRRPPYRRRRAACVRKPNELGDHGVDRGNVGSGCRVPIRSRGLACGHECLEDLPGCHQEQRSRPPARSGDESNAVTWSGCGCPGSGAWSKPYSRKYRTSA